MYKAFERWSVFSKLIRKAQTNICRLNAYFFSKEKSYSFSLLSVRAVVNAAMLQLCRNMIHS